MPDIQLPSELAPLLRARVFALLAEVPAVERPATGGGGPHRRFIENRCVVCGEGGVLGGHHGPGGEIEWIHRSCHRRLHRRARPMSSAEPQVASVGI